MRLVLSLVVLCLIVSFTSAAMLKSISKNKKTASKSTAGLEVRTNSSSAIVPTADGGQLRIDMCEGNVVVPLTSPRNAKRNFTVKSTQFPFKRSTPLICSWNVEVSKNCRRGLVTMTINERSRLSSGDEGCLNGYYSVSPFMDDVKICGRINSVPPFQWYVEDQQPQVTISLKHVGLDDGYSEGLGFTLSGECLAETSNMTKIKATRSYSNWLQQLSDQSQNFGAPTLVLPENIYPTTSIPFWSETDDTNEVISVQPSPTKQPAKIVLDFDLETPWFVLKNYSVPSRTSSPSQTESNTKHPIIHSVSFNKSAEVEPHPIMNLSYTNLNQTAILSTTDSPIVTKSPVAKPLLFSGSNFNIETPWHILKNQSLMATSSPVKNVSLAVPLRGTSASQTVEVIMWT